MILEILNEKLMKALENLERRFTSIRAGRANPSSLDGVMVEYYGVETPLKQLATISVPEARQLMIKPFDKTAVQAIEKAILAANLGYTPGNDGEVVRIAIPILTEDRRRELVKEAKEMAEEARIAGRNIRKEAMNDIDREEMGEDEKKRMETQVQDEINDFNKKIDEKLKAKEEDLLSI